MELWCEYGDDYIRDQTVYTCFITSASITKPNEMIKVIQGAHKDEKDEQNVQCIEFSDTIVEYVPKGLIEIFPNLKSLRIIRCGLKIITQKDLIGFENFIELNLDHNQLVELPNNLFKSMPNLKSISFYGNKLQRLTLKLFVPLLNNKLTYVDLRKNTNIDSYFSSQFSSLPNLMTEIDNKCLEPIEPERQKKEESLAKHQEIMTEGFSELWTSGEYSDFVVVVESREFRVHKNILAMQSPVFKAIFEKDSKERQQNSVTIENRNAADVEEFLRFLYTGKLQEDANVIQLYTIATSFNVPELKSLCEESIVTDLVESNAIEVLLLGHRHSSDRLMQSAFEAIKKMFPDKTLSPDLINEPERLKKMVETKLQLDSFFK